MKKSVVTILLLALMLTSPLICAETQTLQTYSGFSRFVDNARMFFSFGNDGKVNLALEIREKELNSAIANIQENNNEEVNKNLERAFNKLIIIQEKVSPRVAGKVADSVDKIVDKIEESNLTAQLNRYVLEEKKTQLVAELVVEVEGKEGQTLTREIVKNGTEGRNMVKIEIAEENGQVRVVEIEGELAQINNQIAEHTYAGEKGIIVEGSGNGESGVIVEGDDNGVKTSGNETLKNEPLPTPDLNKFNPDLYNPNARAPGDTIDETYDDDTINNGNCGDGVVCNGENNVIEGGEGTEGTNEIAPAVESNEGD